jgi:hypothetical protein
MADNICSGADCRSDVGRRRHGRKSRLGEEAALDARRSGVAPRRHLDLYPLPGKAARSITSLLAILFQMMAPVHSTSGV